MSSETLIDLIDQQRAKAQRSILGADVPVKNYGFICTKNWAVLTSSAALAAAESKSRKDRAKRKSVELVNDHR